MFDPGVSFGAAFDRDPGDPVGSFIAAAYDAWTVGLSALQLMAERSGTGATEAGQVPGGDPLSALIALTNGFISAMSDFVARGAGERADRRPAAPNAAVPGGFAGDTDVASTIARALMVEVTSTLRYWRGLAGVYSRHQGTLMQAATRRTMAPSPTSEAENRLLVDELRALLREVGEVAMQEARRLENELAQIGDALAHGTGEPDPSVAHRRRWKAKD